MMETLPLPVPPADALRVSLLAALLVLPGTASAAETASAWAEGYNNKARLIAGRAKAADGEALYAGVQLAMPSGWKTYWRNPGEAGGVPPLFDWSGSENLQSAAVLYPAPHRMTDKSGTTIGYKESVVFPVKLAAKDGSRPIVLKLHTEYGVCHDICVPAEMDLTLDVAPAQGAAPRELEDALARVPGPRPDPAADPALAKWQVSGDPAKPVLRFEVTDPGGPGGDAFLSGPEGAFLPLPKKISEKGTAIVYEADLSDDYKSLKGQAVTVTLAGSKGQSEASFTLP